MVANVIRSEIILNKKNLLVNSLMVLCLAVAYPLLMEELGETIAFSCFLLGFLPPTLLARQSKVKADATICALPVTRGQLVRGKYAFLGMWTGAAFIVVLVLMPLVYRIRGVDAGSLTADMIVNAAFAITLLSGILSPLVIALGFMGVMVIVLALNIAGVVLLVLTSLRVVSNALDFLFRDVPAALVQLRATLGAPGYHLLLLGGAVAVAALSLWIGRKVYERKEF